MSLYCPRCGEDGTGFEGCASCAAQGVYVNLAPPLADLQNHDLESYIGGPYGWEDTLPIGPDIQPVTLGEGNTPSVPLLVEAGSGSIWIKNEASNPTWSHKDRAMSVSITKAMEIGARTVVIASSGNAGAAAAAYSARAGLTCVVLTTVGIPPAMHRLLTALGAIIVGFETTDQRNSMLYAAVSRLGWYPAAFVDARVGGNPFGNEGYKSVAYELAKEHGDQLFAVVVPTSRADLLSGIGRGFQELRKAGLLGATPKLVAAEPDTGAAFATALAISDPATQERTHVTRHASAAWSIGNSYAHWQGLDAIRRSDGHAVAVDTDTYLAERSRVGRENGFYIEIASAVGVAVARELAATASGITVTIGTSTGLKDPTDTTSVSTKLAVTEPDIDGLQLLVEQKEIHDTK